MHQAKPTSKKKRETYIVELPFPWHKRHWTTEGQELELLPQEAKALLSNGRISKKATAAKITVKSK